jgi:hypothetical protein
MSIAVLLVDLLRPNSLYHDALLINSLRRKACAGRR